MTKTAENNPQKIQLVKAKRSKMKKHKTIFDTNSMYFNNYVNSSFVLTDKL